MIKTEKLIYGALNSDQKFEGSISYDDSISTPRPGILVCHASVSYTHLTLPTILLV